MDITSNTTEREALKIIAAYILGGNLTAHRRSMLQQRAEQIPGQYFPGELLPRKGTRR